MYPDTWHAGQAAGNARSIAKRILREPTRRSEEVEPENRPGSGRPKPAGFSDYVPDNNPDAEQAMAAARPRKHFKGEVVAGRDLLEI